MLRLVLQFYRLFVFVLKSTDVPLMLLPVVWLFMLVLLFIPYVFEPVPVDALFIVLSVPMLPLVDEAGLFVWF